MSNEYIDLDVMGKIDWRVGDHIDAYACKENKPTDQYLGGLVYEINESDNSIKSFLILSSAESKDHNPEFKNIDKPMVINVKKLDAFGVTQNGVGKYTCLLLNNKGDFLCVCDAYRFINEKYNEIMYSIKYFQDNCANYLDGGQEK